MDEGNSRIQKVCLEILDDIDRVCTRCKIHYSLCGGSVIGAYLYGGFIPWDDDIDLMMTREHYDRFLEEYPKQARSCFHLHHYRTDGVNNLPSLFARVEDMRTQTREEIAGSMRTGHVFVDITVMDQVPSLLYGRIARLYAGYLYTFLYRKNGMTPKTRWKRMIYLLGGKMPSDEKLSEKYAVMEDRFRKVSSGKKTRRCAELLSAAYGDILYDQRIFGSYKRVDFEGRRVMIVSDYMAYLKMRYGDREFTRDVPEQNRQKSHIQEWTVQ